MARRTKSVFWASAMPCSWVFIKPRSRPARSASLSSRPAVNFWTRPLDSPCSAAELAEQLTAPDVRSWHIASFRCAAEFGRYRGIAGSDKPSTAITGRHGRRLFCQISIEKFLGQGWMALHGAAFLGGGPLGPRPWPRRAMGRLDHLYWLTSQHWTPLIATAAELPFSQLD